MAGGALEGGGVAEGSGPFSVVGAGKQLELDLAGFAVAGFDGIHKAGADFGGKGEAVDEDEDGLGEVEFEKGLGRGELDDAAGGFWRRFAGEAVVAAAAELDEAGFEGVGEGFGGDVAGGLGGGFRRLLCGALDGFGWLGLLLGGGGPCQRFEL